MSLTILYNQSMKQVSECHALLEHLQPNSFQNPNSQNDLHRISALLDSLSKASDELESMAKREVTETKREIGLSRSNKIKQETQSMKTTLDQFKKEERDRKKEWERSQLLASQYSNQPSSLSTLERRNPSHTTVFDFI